MLAIRRTIADIGDMTPRTATAGEEHDEEPEHDQAGEQEDVRAECRGRLPSAWRRSTHDRGARAGLTATRLPAHGGSGLRRWRRTGWARGDLLKAQPSPTSPIDFFRPVHARSVTASQRVTSGPLNLRSLRRLAWSRTLRTSNMAKPPKACWPDLGCA